MLFLVAIFCVCAVSVAKGEVTVICVNSMRQTMRGLHEELKHATGQKVIMTFDEAGTLRRSLQGGTAADVGILPRVVMDQVLSDGKITLGTTVDRRELKSVLGSCLTSPVPSGTMASDVRRLIHAAPRSTAMPENGLYVIYALIYAPRKMSSHFPTWNVLVGLPQMIHHMVALKPA